MKYSFWALILLLFLFPEKNQAQLPPQFQRMPSSLAEAKQFYADNSSLYDVSVNASLKVNDKGCNQSGKLQFTAQANYLNLPVNSENIVQGNSSAAEIQEQGSQFARRLPWINLNGSGIYQASTSMDMDMNTICFRFDYDASAGGSWGISIDWKYKPHMCGGEVTTAGICCNGGGGGYNSIGFTDATDGASLRYNAATKSFTIRYADNAGGRSENVEITLTPHKINPIKAVVYCKNKADFMDWKPEGKPVDDAQAKWGNKSPDFYVKIIDKTSGKDVSLSHLFATTVTLEKVSNFPGICGNFPAYSASPDRTPDMKWDTSVKLLAQMGRLEELSSTVFRTKQKDGAFVPFSFRSYDYGGFVKLTVKVTFEDGTEMAAETDTAWGKGVGYDHFSVPWDVNNNDIADKWEADKGIYFRNLAANWDEDKCNGDCVKGDGFTLFEEYRGFVGMDMEGHGRGFGRLDPDKRKFFVYYRIADLENYIAMGIRYYKQAADNVFTYRVDKEDDLAIIPNEKLNAGKKQLKRWINFNSDADDTKHFPKQKVCVVRFSNENVPPGVYAQATSKFGNGDAALCVENTYTIYVSFNLNFATDNLKEFPPTTNYPLIPGDETHNIAGMWIKAKDKVKQDFNYDVDLTKIGIKIMENDKRITEHYLVYSVAHELGHATGINHHGEDHFWAKAPADRIIPKVYGEGMSLNGDIPYSDADWRSFFIAAACTGKRSCPIIYWDAPRYYHFMLLLLSGRWSVTDAFSTPYGEPYRFCTSGEDNCAKKLKLKIVGQ